MINAKENHFCTGCPKSALIRGYTKFFVFFVQVHPQQKVGKSQTFSGMGCLKIFLRKEQKPKYPCILGLNILIPDEERLKEPID